MRIRVVLNLHAVLVLLVSKIRSGLKKLTRVIVAVPRVSVATDWLKKYNKKGFLGELGGSDQQNCLDAINDALTHLEANSDVWYDLMILTL